MPFDLSSLLTGGGGMGGGPVGMPPGMPPGGMPPGPPMMPPGISPGPSGSTMPEIPVGDSHEMVAQVQAAGTQIAHIGSRLMARGMHDAAIACAKAVKELEKVPELVHENMQIGPPPNMGGGGMGMGMPMMPPTGPPAFPGMS